MVFGVAPEVDFMFISEQNAHPRDCRIIYRTQWSVYDDVRMIAGQIDAVFYNPTTREYHMVD